MPIVIETERQGLHLRQFIPEDAQPLFELIDQNRPHLSQYLDDTAAKYPDYNSVRESILNHPNPEKLRFGLWDVDVLVGMVHLRPMNQIAELGYWIGSQYTGKGYVTTAARALCAYGFQELNLSSIIAFVHKDNQASQNVLKRCGFEGGQRASFKTDTALVFRLKDESS